MSLHSPHTAVRYIYTSCLCRQTTKIAYKIVRENQNNENFYKFMRWTIEDLPYNTALSYCCHTVAQIESATVGFYEQLEANG